MQDYVSEKTMALVIKGGKISAEVLEGAIKSFIKNTKKTVNKAKEKSATGKQSLKTLQKSGVSLSSVEITKDNIGDFGSVAKKYRIDYSLMKQENASPPVFYVFFKAKDAELLDAAFNEYAQKKYSVEKTGLKETLEKVREIKENQERSEKAKTKAKEKSVPKKAAKERTRELIPERTR